MIKEILRAPYRRLYHFRPTVVCGMSACGTFDTCRRIVRMFVFRGRPEVIGAQSECAFDPTNFFYCLSLNFGGHAVGSAACLFTRGIWQALSWGLILDP